MVWIPGMPRDAFRGVAFGGGGKGGGSSSPPPPPDPAETAAAQAAANKETAIAQARLNQINEFTPFGSVVYSPTGETRDGIETTQRTITLDPAQQAQLDAQNRVGLQLFGIGEDQLARIRSNFSQPYSYDGLPTAPSLETGALARDQVTDALLSRLEPQFDRDRRAMETQLVNQGFTPGSTGYNEAFDEFNRAKTDARMQALLAGGQEQSRLFGLASAERDRAIQEDLTLRNMPLNELSALLGTSPGITVPQFSPPPQTGIAPTDVAGPIQNAYNAELLAWQNKNQAQQAASGQLFGLGGAALGAFGQAAPWIFSGSDSRIKTRAKRISELANGIGVWIYRFILGGPWHIGVMAQEVEKVLPAAVKEIGGVKHVSYAMVQEA